MKFKSRKYKAGNNNILLIRQPEPPEKTEGNVGCYDDANGVLIEWNMQGEMAVVLRKNGVDYKQTYEEFINNCKTK